MNLTSLDLKNFDTQNVTNMEDMFYNCSDLTSLDLKNFDTQNVTNMTGMFFECKNLTSLDMRKWSFNETVNTISMFSGITGINSNIKITISSEEIKNKLKEIYDKFNDDNFILVEPGA